MTALPAVAEERLQDGFYFGGQIGLVLPEDTSTSASGLDFDADYDAGYGIGLVGGWDFGQNFRVEGEWTFRSYAVDSVSAEGFGFKGSGNADLNVLMINGYFDLPWKDHRFVPYIGSGIGLAILSADDVGAGGEKILDDTDTAFAYQFMAGLSYDLTNNVTAGVEYRFLDTTDTLDADIDSTTHSILFNLRYRFSN